MTFLVAKRCDDVNWAGSKNPMYMECFDEDGSSDWLVKCSRVGMINERHLAAELTASVLCKGLGLALAKHRVVVLDDPYIESINLTLHSIKPTLKVTHGFAVGAGKTDGVQPLPVNVTYSSGLWSDASILYAFDLMATHYDRLEHNPNCGLLNQRLFVYDFDQTFPDVVVPSSLYETRMPWQVAKVSYRDLHVFRPWLQQKGVDQDAIRSAFSRLTPDWWERNRPFMPDEWESVAEGIWDQVAQIEPKVEEFVKEVELSLL